MFCASDKQADAAFPAVAAELTAVRPEVRPWLLAEAATHGIVITRETPGEVLAPPGESARAEECGTESSPPRPVAGPVVAGSGAPVWREGLGVSALSVDYQRIVAVLSDRERTGEDGALT
ncbi:hypothetical protein [Streptomyces iconiensis]|uniref:Uncharacterized protein n=1 Tax=Streptomyces iconiensis TaxID=1384038 RepID=A0ABT7A8U1_9ACTN|nr:hypothetical protein [Streptomyces iconiensis]MDJ1137457.1 hypothetical protein [Streptomyces iconiensis]